MGFNSGLKGLNMKIKQSSKKFVLLPSFMFNKLTTVQACFHGLLAYIIP
jgi:hypothetical protein